MSLGHDILSDMTREEFSDRPSDVCPECGSLHPQARPSVMFMETLSVFCPDCHSHWYVRGRKDINR